MKDSIANKIVIAERDNIAAVIEKGKVVKIISIKGNKLIVKEVKEND